MRAAMVTNDRRSLLRGLPPVDALLARPAVQRLAERLPRELVVDAVRAALQQARAAILSGRELPSDSAGLSQQWLEERAIEELDRRLSPSLRPVINATGVVLHTNLGRAPLGARVLQQVAHVGAGYCNLEFDLEQRERGSRHAHVEALLRDLLGVEAALVVNNCAAAVLLVLSALARGGEVVVSRGELVEIGGSFRVPEVMEQSGATLREVGTTNRTKLRDYEAAINERTALLLKAHQSNFAVVGFTESVDGAELSALGRARGIPTAHDLGTGLLVDLEPYGIKGADTVQSELKKGYDLVMFSGDKLLGGPQAGVISGRKDLVTRLKSHPLTRALRVDKTIIGALEATLLCYVDGSALRDVPALAMLTTDRATLEARARAMADRLRQAAGDEAARWKVAVVPATGKVGGGTLPLVELSSRAVRVRHASLATTELDLRLRRRTPAIVGRVIEDHLLLDARTVRDDEIEPLVSALVESAQGE
jgi:L-seryl-tRNA(Ser) seleniumtransferase